MPTGRFVCWIMLLIGYKLLAKKRRSVRKVRQTGYESTPIEIVSYAKLSLKSLKCLDETCYKQAEAVCIFLDFELVVRCSHPIAKIL